MSDWLAHYAAALETRDAREQAHRPYIDAYTRLADKTSAGSSAPPAAAPPSPNPAPSGPTSRSSTPSSTPSSRPKPKDSTATTTSPPTPGQSQPDAMAALRADLTTTQQARAGLQRGLRDAETQLSALRATEREARSQAAAAGRARAEVERRLRDREDEVRGKGALAERAQDEMVALGLQLHMAEARAERLAGENAELVERWMRRVGEEAERVNRDSRWA